MISQLLESYRKVLWFACLGAIGGAAAALAGELWLWASSTAPQPVAVSLVLDTSGSMWGQNLEEMKRAATEFVERGLGENLMVSVVAFENGAQVASPQTKDVQQLRAAIAGLNGGGGTNMFAGIETARTTFSGDTTRRFILVFTDGMPNSPIDANSAAQNCRNQGISVLAVGTGDADIGFLGQLTGDPSLVFPANAGQFAQAFNQADKTIRDLVGAQSASSGSGMAILRVGIWTALLAMGIGLGLIAAQNLYLARAPLAKSELRTAAISGMAAGLAAGVAGQLIYSGAADSAGLLQFLGRSLGWVLMGLVIGAGLARFVPNLKVSRGIAGGAVGGAIGVLAFLIFEQIIAATPGRLAGAAAVGFCIGAMIAWFEAAFREAWLEVKYAGGELRTVALGKQPISFGSDSTNCTLFVPSVAPQALRYTLEDGVPRCEDVPSGKQESLRPGDSKSLGNVVITVRAAGAVATGAPRAASSGAAVEKSGNRGETAGTGSPGRGSLAGATGGGRGENMVGMGELLLTVRGKTLSLARGEKFRATQIPGLEPAGAGDIVAEITSNPNDPAVLGLTNRSRTVWQVTTADGKSQPVATDKTVRVADGTRIRFGATDGRMERQG